MLTVDELFALPSTTTPCSRWNHFVTLLPRLAAETFQTDAGYVLVDGSLVNVLAAIADGIARALLSEWTEDVNWRSRLLQLIMMHQQVRSDDGLDYDYLCHGRYAFKNSGSACVEQPDGLIVSYWSAPPYQFLAPHVAEKSIKILEKWVDVYAENKKPLLLLCFANYNNDMLENSSSIYYHITKFVWLCCMW